ncbi:HET-domain-containing protein [Pyrenochaeta sp. DS3sAY3a]|nr:HET-domain-containing protein [Pyrenochaeta sp. DS3sAY3a]
MRLIDTATLEFQTFNDERQLPPYAILSHTWRDAEVSFEDFRAMLSGNSRERLRVQAMAGFQKIKRTCRIALNHRISYVWVDTCCIDKSSSAELTEAINSMFKWYKKAKVCYAYLDDVNISSYEQELPKARWFTRGWTLQELIAPENMIFFSKDWEVIGSKESLVEALESITTIPNDALCNAPLDGFSVAERMSWIAERETTKAEDLAYALLGIFEVHMSLAYGEGDKAFLRLQEEIMKYSDDQSLFLWLERGNYKTHLEGLN